MFATCTTSEICPGFRLKATCSRCGIAQVLADRRNDAVSRATPGSTVFFFDNSPNDIGIGHGLRPHLLGFLRRIDGDQPGRTFAPNSDSNAFFMSSSVTSISAGDELPQGEHRPQHLAAILLLAKAALLAQERQPAIARQAKTAGHFVDFGRHIGIGDLEFPFGAGVGDQLAIDHALEHFFAIAADALAAELRAA